MSGQQRSTLEKRKNRPSPHDTEKERIEQIRTALLPWKLPLFKDLHLARSVKAEQRATLLQAGQQVLGNRAVQRLLHPEATQGRHFSEQASLPAQGQVEEEEETLQAEKLPDQRQEAITVPVETAPERTVQGSMMGQESRFGPGPRSWEAIAGGRLPDSEPAVVRLSIGASGSGQQGAAPWMLQRQAAGETVEPFAVPRLPAHVGYRFTYSQQGKKPLGNFHAKWKTFPRIRHQVKKRGDLWYARLTAFRCRGKYWLNSKTKWNHIKDFPGGDYDGLFNTPEGSRVHERAELRAVGRHWKTLGQNLRAGSGIGFKTPEEAERNWRTVFTKAEDEYVKNNEAVSEHKNRVGPDAEWEYYRQQHARYRRRRGEEEKAPGDWESEWE